MNLKDYEVKSNPFDVFTQTALELARSALFVNSRLRNANVWEPYSKYDEDWSSVYLKHMQEQLEILNNITPEELEFCREHAYMNTDDHFDVINTFLFEHVQNMETECSKIAPAFSDEEEKIYLGEDSCVFKRHRELKELLAKYYNTEYMSTHVLSKCIDAMNRGFRRAAKDYGWSGSYKCKVREALDILEAHAVTADDIEYLIRLRERSVDPEWRKKNFGI